MSSTSTYRYMRILLMFDLPTIKAKERKAYRDFVKFLKKEGFIMFQESIYVKLAINEASAAKSIKAIDMNLPPSGLVSLLKVTEKQFASMDYLLGDFHSDVINSDERYIEL